MNDCTARHPRYPDARTADAVIAERHLRAQLAGNPRRRDLHARPCPDCHGWHIHRAPATPEGAAA